VIRGRELTVQCPLCQGRLGLLVRNKLSLLALEPPGHEIDESGLMPPEARVMLVGHEPSFSEVIGAITGGSLVVCKKGSLARVDLTDRDRLLGLLVWLLPPKAMLA